MPDPFADWRNETAQWITERFRIEHEEDFDGERLLPFVIGKDVDDAYRGLQDANN